MGTNRRPRPQKLAGKLFAIRERLDISQEDMASRLTSTASPVYPTHISEFERDRREPSLIVLLKYAEIGGVSTDALIDDRRELPGGRLIFRTRK